MIIFLRIKLGMQDIWIPKDSCKSVQECIQNFPDWISNEINNNNNNNNKKHSLRSNTKGYDGKTH
jgi:hypothetical protein